MATILLLVALSLSALVLTAPPSAALAPAWQPDTPYSVGQVASYEGVDYTCLQAHTSQTGWEPPSTPALWERQ